MPTIFLIRHAQASFGTADYDALSELGREQAIALDRGLRARGVEPDRIVRGTLRRLRQTVELCGLAAGVTVTIDARLDEYDHADLFESYAPQAVATWNGVADSRHRISPAHLQALLDSALGRWAEDGDGGACEESWPAFRDRSLGALTDLGAELERGERALAFTSAGVVAAICSHLLGASAAGFVALNRVAVNTGVTTLALGRGGTSLISFNDHSHLETADRALVTYR